MKGRTEFPAAPPPRKELSDNPVKLCNEIARLFRHVRRGRDVGEGVMTQPGAHLILSVLAVYEGLTQQELVRKTHLRAPTVSVILRKMEGEGLVTRENDPNDLRSVRVGLTEAGRALDRRQIALIQALDAAAMDGLTEEEKQGLMTGLLKIRDNLLRTVEEDTAK